MLKLTIVAAVAAAAVAPLTHAKLPKRHDPATFAEVGTNYLLWLRAHPRAGTPRSRAAVRRDGLWLVVDGLRRAGVLGGLHCVHRKEGSWRDYGDPYWGGLQMDRGFQASYGRDFVRAFGLADRWPPWAQMVAAYRAIRAGRGWHPWPNTAHACGLL